MLLVATSVTAIVSDNVKDEVVQSVDLFTKINHFFIERMPDFIAGIIIIIIGYYISKTIRSVIERMMGRAGYDHTGISFLGQIIYYLSLIVFIIIGLTKVGIPTNSLVASFGAFAIAIGLALQNNMSNFASGILILMFKPFKAGDWVSVNGIEGSIRSIQMLNTAIVTKENRIVFVPNSIITSQAVTNSNYLEHRYIALNLGISYENDHHRAIEVLKEIFQADERILNAPHAEIGIKSFGESSVNIAAYLLVENVNYLAVYYSLMSEIKDRFDAEGISIPYPQRVVHISKAKTMKSDMDIEPVEEDDEESPSYENIQ